jgi:hypothetical protein
MIIICRNIYILNVLSSEAGLQWAPTGLLIWHFATHATP